MKTSEESNPTGYPKSYVRSRYGRKRSLKIEEQQNYRETNSRYSQCKNQTPAETEIMELDDILNEFSVFVSELNYSTAESLNNKNINEIESVNDSLKKRADDRFETEESNVIKPRRSKRIKEFQMKKNKKKKKQENLVNKHSKKLDMIHEEQNPSEEKSKEPSKHYSVETTKMDQNEDFQKKEEHKQEHLNYDSNTYKMTRNEKSNENKSLKNSKQHINTNLNKNLESRKYIFSINCYWNYAQFQQFYFHN